MNREYIRSSLAIASAQHFSPVLRNAIFSDDEFRNDFHLTLNAVVNFGNGDIGFRRPTLFDAIKAAFATNGEEITVADTAGNAWKVEILLDRDPVTVAVGRGEKLLLNSNLVLLSPDEETRIKSFRHHAERVNLPQSSRNWWMALLRGRALNDDEIGTIQDDLGDTPMAVCNAVRTNLVSGTISLEVLVPRSLRYYERLVGRYEDGMNLEDYVHKVAVPLMRSNIAWRAFDGYQLSLLLASQPTFALALGELETEEGMLARVLDWSATEGDAISRASCIEIGLRRVLRESLINEPLSKVIDSFVKDAQAAHIDQFKLLSVIFIAVYGEMSSRRMFSFTPPFWRKLAALAQTCIIVRQFIAIGHDVTEVVDWFRSVRAEIFTLQCFVDMRLEPRWMAELASAKQLRNELVGRAWLAAKSNEQVVDSLGWTDRLLGVGDGTMSSQFQLALAFLPGPLEGNLRPLQELPNNLLDTIQSDLSGARTTIASYLALANASMIYRIPPMLADLAAAAMVRANYRIEIGDSDVSLTAVLLAVAHVAAVTRNHSLADSLFILLRKYREFYPNELSITDTIRVAVVASSSRDDLLDWAKCVGRCMNDMAFQKITREEAIRLRSNIVCICHLVPELWSTCGQAEAALQAVLGS